MLAYTPTIFTKKESPLKMYQQEGLSCSMRFLELFLPRYQAPLQLTVCFSEVLLRELIAKMTTPID